MMNNGESPMNKEQNIAKHDRRQKMTKKEEITMQAELTHRLWDQTFEYVETVRKTLQAYPELKRTFDIVIALDVLDNPAIRCISCSSTMRDNLVTDLLKL